jgi:hypothetical protein
MEPASAVESESGGVIEPATATREATAEDLERIESLTLDDFATDFSGVELPESAPGERLSETQLTTAALEFVAVIQNGRTR